MLAVRDNRHGPARLPATVPVTTRKTSPAASTRTAAHTARASRGLVGSSTLPSVYASTTAAAGAWTAQCARAASPSAPQRNSPFCFCIAFGLPTGLGGRACDRARPRRGGARRGRDAPTGGASGPGVCLQLVGARAPGGSLPRPRARTFTSLGVQVCMACSSTASRVLQGQPTPARVFACCAASAPRSTSCALVGRRGMECCRRRCDSPWHTTRRVCSAGAGDVLALCRCGPRLGHVSRVELTVLIFRENGELGSTVVNF